MKPTIIPLFLLPFLAATTILAQSHNAKPHPLPRHLDAILMEPVSSPTPTSTPHIKHLDLRQAVANNGAAANAPKPAAPAVNAPAAPAPQAAAPVPPGAIAPGGGGAGGQPAAAQPAPGAQAPTVTTQFVQTVIAGKPTSVATVVTIAGAAGAGAGSGGGGSPPSVMSGSIGLGTLTGKVGVVKTGSAKSAAAAGGGRGLLLWEGGVMLGWWVFVAGVVGGIVGRGVF